MALPLKRPGMGLVTQVSRNLQRPVTVANAAMTVAHSPPGSQWSLETLFKKLGPGVITGAADDDPSGIATYSQAGAQRRLRPALDRGADLAADGGGPVGQRPHRPRHRPRSRRQHGEGLSALRRHAAGRCCCSSPTPSISAPTSRPWAPRPSWCWAAAQHLYTLLSPCSRLLAIVFMPYHRYVAVLKWLTFSLFAYVGVVFTVQHRLARRWRRARFVPQARTVGRGADPGRRDVRHHHQPLSLLLAELAGGRGRGGRSGRRAAAASAPSRRGASCTASAGRPGSAWRSPTWSPSSSS